MAEGLFSKKIYQNIAITIVIVSIIFFAFLLIYGIKIRNNEYCAVTNDFPVGPAIVNSTTINNSGDAVLNKFSYNVNDFEFKKTFEICYQALISTNNGLRISVIDNQENNFGTFLLRNGSNNECLLLTNNNDLQSQSFLGIRCDTCNDTETITFLADSLVTQEHIVVSDGLSSFVIDDRPIINSRYTSNCRPLFKTFLLSYITIVGLLLFVVIVIIGLEYLKNILFKGWDL